MPTKLMYEALPTCLCGTVRSSRASQRVKFVRTGLLLCAPTSPVMGIVFKLLLPIVQFRVACDVATIGTISDQVWKLCTQWAASTNPCME